MITLFPSPNHCNSPSPRFRAALYCSPRSSIASSSPQTRAIQPLPRSSQPPALSVSTNAPGRTSTASNITTIETVDAGTQYTPPDWPPTSYRASSRLKQHPANQSNTDAAIAHTTSSEQSVPQNLAESNVRDDSPTKLDVSHSGATPQTSLRHGGATFRRSRHEDSAEGYASGSTGTASKRPRQQNEKSKVMPVNYWNCNAKDLASLISDMLMELIHFNDEIPLRDGHLTRFHSRAPPGISVYDYLQRLTHHATLMPAILLSMISLTDKLCSVFPAFTINSLTVHRFLITSATVSAKGLSDSFWTNSIYAKVGGVTIKELALLELELLERVDWRIVPDPESLVGYYNSLIERNANYVLETEEAVDTAATKEAPSTQEGSSDEERKPAEV